MEPPGTPPETDRPQPTRPVVVTRRRLVAVATLALAGGALSGRVAERAPRPLVGALPSVERRRRLRIALIEEHATKLRPLLARFEETYDTAIAVTALAPGDLYALLAVDVLHETQSFDVVSLSDDWIANLGRSGALVSDQDLVSDESLALADDRVSALGRSIEDGRLVAAPWSIDIGFTAVDGAAVRMTDIPSRWSGFAELLEGSGLTTLALPAASGDVAATTFRAILLGYGTDIVEVETNRPMLTDYVARRAVADMRRLLPFTSISPLAIDDRAVDDLLSRGAVSSCAHVWSSTWLEAGAPASWTLLPPLRASAPRGSSLLRAWLLAIPKTAADIELSRDFVEWMRAPAAQRSLLDVGLVPSSRAVLGDREEQTRRPGLADIVRGLSISRGRPRLRAFTEINRVCGEAIAAILAGNASAGSAFRTANSEMRRILEREGELRD